jgi:hypothetical protein
MALAIVIGRLIPSTKPSSGPQSGGGSWLVVDDL